MAFDKIVAADSATYDLPPLVRDRLATNISTEATGEYTAVESVVNAVLAGADLGSLPQWTTAGRPATPGDSALIGFNTETETVEFYNTVTDEWEPIGAGSKFTVSTTAPAEAENGDTWFNSETGSTYIYYVDGNSSQWVEIGGSGGSGDVTISDYAPTSPQPGDLWYDSVTGSTFIYYEDADSTQWVEIGQTAQPTSAYIRETAPPEAENGQLWLDSTDGRLYVYYIDGDSSQWIGVRSAESTTGAFVSETAPLAPNPGDLWLDSTEGLMYVWYVDGDSSQWVAAVGGTNTPPPLTRADLPAGSVLQVVSTVKTDTFANTTNTYADVPGLTVTVTPSSSSNKILIIAQVQSNGSHGHLRLNGGNSDAYVGDASSNRVRSVFGFAQTVANENTLAGPSGSMVYLDSPNTTSATTYAVQVRGHNSVAGFVNRTFTDSDSVNGTRGASSITVMEVAG